MGTLISVQGPAGNLGAELRRKLASQGKNLAILGNDDETANRNYTKYFALARTRAKAHGLQYAEYFHHITPDRSAVEAYVRQNATAL